MARVYSGPIHLEIPAPRAAAAARNRVHSGPVNLRAKLDQTVTRGAGQGIRLNPATDTKGRVISVEILEERG